MIPEFNLRNGPSTCWNTKKFASRSAFFCALKLSRYLLHLVASGGAR